MGPDPNPAKVGECPVPNPARLDEGPVPKPEAREVPARVEEGMEWLGGTIISLFMWRGSSRAAIT